jgi:hypothetical protein
MRAGAFILTLLMALLSFEASGSGTVPVRDAHGEIAVSVSSHTPVCPDHVALRHQCCLAICGSLIFAPANTLTLQFLLLERLTGSSDPVRATTTAARLYRPPKRL